MKISGTGWALITEAGVSVWLLAPEANSSADSMTGSDLPRALVGLGSLVQLGVSAWILLVAVISLLGCSSRLVRRVTPQLLRRALFAGTVGALAFTPAQASPHAGSHPRPAAKALAGLRLPDRPEPAAESRPAVIVQSGDTLWAIAERSLPHGATDAAIAAQCALWYATNRSVIGPDPDVILPSQHLIPPQKDRP